MSAAEPVVEIRNLEVDFRTFDGVSKVLVGVNLELRRGDILGLVGETGCGKSVTALSVPRLIPMPPGQFVGGDVRFLGESVLEKSPAEMRELRARHIGMVFQDPNTNLNPVFTIEQQMVDACLCRLGHAGAVTTGPFKSWRSSDRELRRQARETAVALLQRVGFPDPERRIASYPHELSGGMRQRVLIAMSLAGHPDLLIADEPTTALDVSTQAQILGLIRELVQEFHLTVLLITHNLGVVAQVCNRVAVMYSGRVVESGSVRRVFKAPSHPYTIGLLRAVPTMETVRGTLEEIPGTIPNLLTPPAGCRFHPRCPHVMDDCRVDPPPPMFPLEGGTEVACHLYAHGARPNLLVAAEHGGRHDG
ncbi:MAG TPA: ABC transporter ATP-binding protein [Thermomicrobiaceae bacterium]|nr:ABC transporter ATP-binding protein [Thermomicrobiaceae bacterium]